MTLPKPLSERKKTRLGRGLVSTGAALVSALLVSAITGRVGCRCCRQWQPHCPPLHACICAADLALASAPLWAALDLLAGSLPGLLADLTCTVTGGLVLLRRTPS